MLFACARHGAAYGMYEFEARRVYGKFNICNVPMVHPQVSCNCRAAARRPATGTAGGHARRRGCRREQNRASGKRTTHAQEVPCGKRAAQVAGASKVPVMGIQEATARHVSITMEPATVTSIDILVQTETDEHEISVFGRLLSWVEVCSSERAFSAANRCTRLSRSSSRSRWRRPWTSSTVERQPHGNPIDAMLWNLHKNCDHVIAPSSPGWGRDSPSTRVQRSATNATWDCWTLW